MSDHGPVNTNQTDEVSPVAVPGTGYSQMAEAWELILDLLGGTRAMREAAKKWLPQEAQELDDSYFSRLHRSILYNALKDTISKLRNRPFKVPVIVTDLPDGLSYLEEDVDGMGTTLSDFAKGIIENLIKFGKAHIYVDHSNMAPGDDGSESTARNRQDSNQQTSGQSTGDTAASIANITIQGEKDAGARVFFWNISPVDLIGWQTETLNNVTNLTQIRVQETAIEPNGDYDDMEVKYINVFNKDSWEIWRQDDDDPNKYDIVGAGPSTLGKIPLITIYADKTGFLTADPPMEDLAWLNLAHWQSYSDQRNILKYSRFALLFGRGIPKKQIDAADGVVVGPMRAILTESETAELMYVEPAGKGIEAGENDLADLEKKMQVLGNQPMVKNVAVTATTDRIDESRTVSQLQAWVVAAERGLLHALELASEWRKIDPPETMQVDIFHDFEATVLGGGDKDLLHKMRDKRQITNELMLREEQRRGVFSEDMDPEAEAKAVADEEEDIANLEAAAALIDDEEPLDDDDDLLDEE
jgi:hypothetical protein